MGTEGPALGPALPLREPLGPHLPRRAQAPRLAALVALTLLAACAAAPPPPPPAEQKDALRGLPDVICQPCGQMQPTGYLCSGPVMVRSDVPAARVPRLKRYCAEKRKRAR